MKFDITKLNWTNKPKESNVTQDIIEIITEPHTDLWQRTYYKFRNDNAPMLQMQTSEKEFSFDVFVQFDSQHNFDQAGIIMYLDSENWLKSSIEYGDESSQYLGVVATNNGYSDWSTSMISSKHKAMWLRLSRRGQDFCIENSFDGIDYSLMRITHMFNANETIQFGVYACSPEQSSFKATFSKFKMSTCQWALHEGQQPDPDCL